MSLVKESKGILKSQEKLRNEKEKFELNISFRNSDSILIKYTAIKDFVAIKNIFFIVVLSSIISLFVRDIKNGKLFFSGFRLIPMGFSGLSMALLMWIALIIASFAVHFSFHVWILTRKTIKNGIFRKKIWDITFIAAYISYVFGNFYFVGITTIANNLQFGCIIAIVSEMLRILMKTYVYIRSNIPKVVPEKVENKEIWNDSFSHYIFYLIVPTIVYKDKYERKGFIRWSLILNLCFELILSAFVMAIFFDLSYVPRIIESGGDHPFIAITYISIETVVQGLILHFLLDYIILHCLQNIIAEIVGYEDRAFYGEYWTMIHFTQFRKKTNLIIHEFFQNYVFSDVMYITNNKTISKVICTLISGLSHEFALSLFLQSFFPLLTAEFVIGVIVFDYFATNKPALRNFILLILLGFGTSTNMVAYTMMYCSIHGFGDYKQCLGYF